MQYLMISWIKHKTTFIYSGFINKMNNDITKSDSMIAKYNIEQRFVKYHKNITL